MYMYLCIMAGNNVHTLLLHLYDIIPLDQCTIPLDLSGLALSHVALIPGLPTV